MGLNPLREGGKHSIWWNRANRKTPASLATVKLMISLHERFAATWNCEVASN
jgi:hypothetical protein